MCWPVVELKTHQNISVGDTVNTRILGDPETVQIESMYMLKHSKNVRVVGLTDRGVRVDVHFGTLEKCSCELKLLLLNGCQCKGI